MGKRRKKIENEVKGWALGFLLVWFAALILFYFIGSKWEYYVLEDIWYLSFQSLLHILALIGLWHLKKWGLYLFVSSFLVYNIYILIYEPTKLFFAIIVAGIFIYYIWKRKEVLK